MDYVTINIYIITTCSITLIWSRLTDADWVTVRLGSVCWNLLIVWLPFIVAFSGGCCVRGWFLIVCVLHHINLQVVASHFARKISERSKTKSFTGFVWYGYGAGRCFIVWCSGKRICLKTFNSNSTRHRTCFSVTFVLHLSPVRR